MWRWETLDSFMQHDVQELCRVVSPLKVSQRIWVCSCMHLKYLPVYYSWLFVSASGQCGKQNERHLCWGNHPQALQRKDGGMFSLWLLEEKKLHWLCRKEAKEWLRMRKRASHMAFTWSERCVHETNNVHIIWTGQFNTHRTPFHCLSSPNYCKCVNWPHQVVMNSSLRISQCISEHIYTKEKVFAASPT